MRGSEENRETLIPYFQARHRSGDRLQISSYRFNGYDRPCDLGHFELAGRRRADDIRDGEWVPMAGKGALDCSRPTATLAVLLVEGNA